MYGVAATHIHAALLVPGRQAAAAIAVEKNQKSLPVELQGQQRVRHGELIADEVEVIGSASMGVKNCNNNQLYLGNRHHHKNIHLFVRHDNVCKYEHPLPS